VLVAQADAADVARRLLDRGQVEPAEDQALVGGVERGDPLGRLEDHGVALDQTALVTEPGAAVPLQRERLGVAGGRLELGVDTVHELLLVRDLPLRHALVGSRHVKGQARSRLLAGSGIRRVRRPSGK
jgi:hypothetical protein